MEDRGAQPPSTIGKDLPTVSAIDLPTGQIMSDIYPVTRPTALNATASSRPEENASFHFIPNALPTIIIISGRTIVEPRSFTIKPNTFDNISILSYLSFSYCF